MKLIEILRKRASDDKFEKEICTALCSKADEIIKQASAHLEYVRNVLDEFDMHNVKHSEGVLQIIEDLLGENAEKLSSYDLFSLIAVAYLHDCGMAVSDAEINVMKLVENEEFDGKKVCTEEEAINVIKNSRKKIFETERDAEEIKNWLFYPGSEQKLFEYYAQLLRDYLTFRNGKTDVIKKSTDLNQTNKDLRLEYIRSKHAERAETYIKTLGEKDNAVFHDNQSMGQLLFDNIAMACKAHGEDSNYITELDKDSGYIGSESSNIQFVAMMLRIGDIVHFSYERAPIVLRALHHFESDYSFEQWRIKADSGVNFNTKGGVIVCNANCKAPKDYYNLMSYIDWIDHELELYNRLKRNEEWDEKYPDMPKKVDRSHMKHAKTFNPVPGLKFTLEQNKILDLLMGAELYSDEYACLRELYQNSLDACRCQISKDKSKGKDSKGEIEFGLADENGERYVYCLDNGKGMSKHIIENYLLKIGSSYYKSSEFYQSQAETGNTFTPTSQFGIGILSCFMIGDRVEITTREDGGDYISCVMENLHECFYYKETPQKDKDNIPSSGTLVKIFLKKKYQERISNEYFDFDFDFFDLLLWKKENKLDKGKRTYLNHLFFILDDFVKMVPDNITLNIRLSKGNPIQIYNKPLLKGKESYTDLQAGNNKYNIKKIEKIGFLELDVEHDGIRYKSFLILQKEISPFTYHNDEDLLLGRNAYCVDGIKVDNTFVKGNFLLLTKEHNLGGILNFFGAERPQLSVSREKIVKYNPEKFEGKIKVLLGKLVEQAIDKTASYIKDVKPDSILYEKIWNCFFYRFEHIPANIVAQHLTRESIKDLVMPLPKEFTSSKMTFGEFFGDEVHIDKYCMFTSKKLMECSKLLKQILLYRIKSSTSISFDKNNVSFTGYLPNITLKSNFIQSGDGLFKNYDIVTSLYPFFSSSLGKLEKDYREYLYYYAEGFLRILASRNYNSKEEAIESILENDLRISYRKKENNNPEIYSFLADFFNRNKLLPEVDSYSYYRSDMVFTFYIPITKEQLEMSPLVEYVTFFPHLFNKVDTNNTNYEGLSVIVFGKDDYHVLPGCWTRQELIDMIPNDVWKKLPNWRAYHFSDGTPVRRSKKRS